MEKSENMFFEVPIINLEDVENSQERATEPTSNKNSSNKSEKLQGSSPSNINWNSNKVKAHNLPSTTNKEPPIVIDDDSEKDNDCAIIDLIDSQENRTQKTNSNKSPNCEGICDFEILSKENKLLADMIEKCLDMEYSDGMLRIIKRTVIPLYKNADEKFKKSDMFEKILSQVIIKLETEPNKRFSHLQGLCEALKLSKEKVKVSLVTLKRNLHGKFSTNKTRFSDQNHKTPTKKKKMDVIDLDDDDDEIIDCSSDTDLQINDIRGQAIDDQSSVQVIHDCDSCVDVSFNIGNNNGMPLNEPNEKDDDIILIDDKENRTDSKHNNLPERSNNSICRKKNNTLNNNEAPEIDLCNDDDDTQHSSNILDTNVLSKSMALEIHNPQCVDVKEHNIAYVEKEIEKYSAIVKKLEEKEVYDDSIVTSPYVQCDIYKAKVVSLYKELCKLTGTASVKRHKVRLKVAAGRHKGPVRCLEKFINKNIDDNGNPPFPDIHDVISCVCKANTQYNMGWTKKQIEAEARALFIYYGQTVQKRRQKREWRHLLTYVKKEAPDPADEDQALRARLQENSKLAQKNEKELIDRYAQMENSNGQDSDCDIPSLTNGESENKINENQNRETVNYAESDNGLVKDNLALFNPRSAPAQQVASFERTIDPICSATDNQSQETLITTIAGTTHNFAVHINNPEPCSSNGNIAQSFTNAKIVSDTQKSKVTEYKKANAFDFKPNLGVSNPYITIIPIFTPSAAIQNNEVNTGLAESITVTSNDVDNKVNVIDNTEVPDSLNAYDRSKDRGLQSFDLNDSAGSSQVDYKNVKVKHEPLDIPYLLAQLGDNYTATIIDIEDPFMVIEISDSSDSEDESEQ